MTLKFKDEFFIDYTQMKVIEESGSHQILDSRLPENFSGADPEPCVCMYK